MYNFAGRATVFILGFGMLCVLVFGLIFSALDTSSHGGFSSEQTAAWAGAMATYLAFGGTLWIATIEWRRRRRDALELAALTASALVTRLRDASTLCGQTLEWLDTLPGEPTFDPLKIQLLAGYEHIRLWDSAELVPLIVLGKDIAAQLARMPDRLESIKNAINSEIWSTVQPNAQDRAKLHQEIKSARDQLVVSSTECAFAIYPRFTS